MRSSVIVALLATFLLSAARAEVTIDLKTARLVLDDRGAARLTFADDVKWPASNQPVFALRVKSQWLTPQAVERRESELKVAFEGGHMARFAIVPGEGFVAFRLIAGSLGEDVEEFRLFHLDVPEKADVMGTLNAVVSGPHVAALLAAEPNVHAAEASSDATRGDRPGCRHEFVHVAEAKVGRRAARFTAMSNDQPGGWSMQGKAFDRPLDLSGCRGIRLWVHGDGKGQQLKIQLFDGEGGYRDNYLPIDFTGWRQVTLRDSALDSLRYDRVRHLNIYYNSLPAGQTVTCLLDQIEAVLQRDGREETVVLEDFESDGSPLFAGPVRRIGVRTARQHGIEPAAFGLVACPRKDLWDVMPRFEVAAGLPSPRPGGVWNKRSPWIHRSYLFLTDFRPGQFDEALAIARRGGFHTILFGQESWCRSTGHYEVPRDRFPEGLEGLKRTLGRFKAEGFRVGLHFLGPSIYPPDAYLTPVPDPRLVKDVTTRLAADVDEKADVLPVVESPRSFPAEDGGYMGNGTVLQIGDELIVYGDRALDAPYRFVRCQRGHLGTKPAAHKKGERVAHLSRSYGYHLFDMDTTLIDEVATNFARVANACGIDMIYFDGSEWLQGDHWYYNARLHRAFYDKLTNKDMLLQASSYSHYSWHLLARSASADGHGDLKGYLDERSPWFTSFSRDGMPLDIGWYYGYDTAATPDMYEYVLGATIGYDSSMSFQVSTEAAARHPFTGEILDLIRRYERLRLSGRVPEAMKARLRIDAIHGGQKTPEERARLADQRRDYRLVGAEGHEAFQRVVYGPWQEFKAIAPEAVWPLEVKAGPARVGFQVQLQSGPWLAAGPAYRSPKAIVLETFDDLAPYANRPGKNVAALAPGEAGSVLPGVTQRIERRDEGAKEGRSYAVYTAQSTLDQPAGWSVFGKAFDPPLDLSRHRGIGFWLRGDGHGGAFKLQLRDDKGATDYYVPNDFTGWRYQQLPRPEKDPIDYRAVRYLSFYYNGLPAKSTVSCGIDDVKALAELDRQTLADPSVKIGDARLAWKGTLTEGQYLTVWPGEPAVVHGLPLATPQRSATPFQTVELPVGKYQATFGHAGERSAPIRVRVMLQPPERHAVPE
jgi:hypothetical protein